MTERRIRRRLQLYGRPRLLRRGDRRRIRARLRRYGRRRRRLFFL